MTICFGRTNIPGPQLLNICYPSTFLCDSSTVSIMRHVVLYTTVPNLIVGDKIAVHLVQNRLVACVNRIPQVHSTYRWEGKIEVGVSTINVETCY